MNRFRFRITYHGAHFAGWQYQPDVPTVQSTLQNAFAAVGEQPVIVGAGRTDAGVHSTGQVAHVDLPRKWESERLEGALNANLPMTIRVADASLVAPEFHARFRATGRCYVYRLTNVFEPLRADTELMWDYPVDRELVEVATKSIIGKHDFSAYILDGSTGSPVCNVYDARWQWDAPRFRFRIYADRYGWKMVRQLVGVLLAVGRKKFPVDYITERLQQGRDPKWNEVVPAHGLIYAGVTYPDSFGGPETPPALWFERTDW